MLVSITLYGTARVVIGQPQIDIAFDSHSVTLGEVLERIIALYPRVRPYLLDESGRLPYYMRILINEGRPDLDATPATLLHDQDRVTLLVAVAGGERRDLVIKKTFYIYPSVVGFLSSFKPEIFLFLKSTIHQ
ncbi:MAG: MoaD/ThiS family protein [Ktedonobacteraceae bacterium]